MSGTTPSARRPRVAFGTPPSTGPGFGAGSPEFEEEWTVLLSRRLRLLVTVLWGVGLFAYVANLATEWAVHGFERGWPHAETPLLVGVLVGVAIHGLLVRVRLGRRGLEAVDAVLLLALFAVFALEYHLDYGGGGARAVPFVGLFTVVRAVVVPSRPGFTAAVSAVGPLALFALQVLHGRAGDPVPAKLPEWTSIAPFSELWWSSVAWDHLYLGIAVGTAALASSVNFRLRLKAHEARRLDRYVLEELVGRGAMGEVYRARHPLLPRPVAVKLLRPDVVDEGTAGRFEEEVRQTSRLSHPSNPVVYDFGRTADGTFYYAMELLDGADLQRIVAATGPFPAARVVHVLVHACGALHEAHERGLVHRDVKPANLLLCERAFEPDVVKVTDYGLVKDLAAAQTGRTETGAIVGTPETLAPELVQGEPATRAVDVYGLAAVGVFLLTGRPLFEAHNLAELLYAQAHTAPPRPSARRSDVPPDLEAVLLRALSKDPTARQSTAAALRTELLRCDAAGRWSEADARRWWTAHGAAVRGAGPGGDATPTAAASP
jgi:serine/threonine-protein kinase